MPRCHYRWNMMQQNGAHPAHEMHAVFNFNRNCNFRCASRWSRFSLRRLAPTVAQTDDAIEYGLTRFRIDPVGDEIAMALELIALFRQRVARARFQVGVDHALRIRIQRVEEVAATGV